MTGSVEEWRDEGETSRERPIAPLHLHRGEDEAWYVLEGALGFKAGDEELHADAGRAVIVPAGTPHSYWNAAAGLTRPLISTLPACTTAPSPGASTLSRTGGRFAVEDEPPHAARASGQAAARRRPSRCMTAASMAAGERRRRGLGCTFACSPLPENCRGDHATPPSFDQGVCARCCGFESVCLASSSVSARPGSTVRM